MVSIPLWNQKHLGCPATSAHKVDISNQAHLQVVLTQFLKDCSDKLQQLNTVVLSMKSEAILLKRFLYKLAAVLAHDKSHKLLMHLSKSVNRVLGTDLISDLTSFIEQHSIKTSSKAVFVAPKPKYEYLLVRLQGLVRLLAQILCHSQNYGSMVAQRLHLGHFINIFVICMSFVSRLWALSLHMIHLLINLFDSINTNFKVKGLIPDSAVNFLPEEYKIPSNLVDWLRTDNSLKEIFSILNKESRKPSTSSNSSPDIWQVIQGDDEKPGLMELENLVLATSVKEEAKNLTSYEPLLANKLQLLSSVDIGEVVSRDNIPRINNKKRKRARNPRKVL